MITRTEAERLALAIHTLRGDWPTASILTLIRTDLTHWPLRDLGVALVHVALDQHPNGDWVSATPARVKENGPWRADNGETAAARARDQRAVTERKTDATVRGQAIHNCRLCDTDGRLPSGALCLHDPDAEARARRGAALVRQALQQRKEPA